MKLYLLRHAKTEILASGQRDIDRNLLPKGKAQASLLGQYPIDLSGTDVHCSSSTRTRQTLDELLMHKQVGAVFFTEDLYLASSKEILDYLNDLSTKRDVLLIGHNEGISDFASWITGDYHHFKTAMLMELELELDDWAMLSAQTARVIKVYRPEVD